MTDTQLRNRIRTLDGIQFLQKHAPNMPLHVAVSHAEKLTEAQDRSHRLSNALLVLATTVCGMSEHGDIKDENVKKAICENPRVRWALTLAQQEHCGWTCSLAGGMEMFDKVVDEYVEDARRNKTLAFHDIAQEHDAQGKEQK